MSPFVQMCRAVWRETFSRTNQFTNSPSDPVSNGVDLTTVREPQGAGRGFLPVFFAKTPAASALPLTKSTPLDPASVEARLISSNTETSRAKPSTDLLICQTVAFLLLFVTTTSNCHAAQADFQSTADVLKSRQQTIVKLFGAGSGNLDSYGTGTLVSADGHVITVWNHLVSTGFLNAVTADGRKFSVEVVGTSAEHDLALLKLGSEPGDSFPHIDLTMVIDSVPGTPVLAFSNMFHVATGNEPVTLVHGVIAARIPLEATQGRWKFPLKSPVWLVDAITNNSGAAGGLLTDTKGNPIGLIGREIRHSASRTWVNYAVPLTTLKPVIEELLAGKKVDSRPKDAAANLPMISDQQLTARFGLTMLPNVVERTPAWIDTVVNDSIAAKAGLQRGDLIVLVNDAVITSVTDFQQQLASFRSGERVSLTINRDQQLLPVDFKFP